MPELPEVETMRRGVLPVVGSTIKAVISPPCERRPIAMTPRVDQIDRVLKGQRIAAIERRGKRVMLRSGNGELLILEPRMTGLVLIADPPTSEHLRLRIRLTGGPHRDLWFWDRRGLGTVRLLDAEQAASWLQDAPLGKDALEISALELRQQLGTSKRPIKVALLDQKHVAGIGNLYAAEILHVAKISPLLSCDGLSTRQWTRLHAAIGQVLLEAIRYEGSTLSDGTYRNALNTSGSYQNHHRVYDRQGKPCLRCRGQAIERIVQAQRSTFYCPKCQT